MISFRQQQTLLEFDCVNLLKINVNMWDYVMSHETAQNKYSENWFQFASLFCFPYVQQKGRYFSKLCTLLTDNPNFYNLKFVMALVTNTEKWSLQFQTVSKYGLPCLSLRPSNLLYYTTMYAVAVICTVPSYFQTTSITQIECAWLGTLSFLL
jgi:hypothetical protein